MKIAVLSGGVGGARFLRGLVEVVDPRDITIIGNVGDDLEVLGQRVSPDLDTVAICCDLDAHVYNPTHTDPAVVEALKGTYWTDVRESSYRQ